MDWLIWIVLITLGIVAITQWKKRVDEQDKERAEEDRKRQTLLSMLPYFQAFERAERTFTGTTRNSTRVEKLGAMQAALAEMYEIDPSNQDVLAMRQSVEEMESCLLGEIHAEKVNKLVQKFDSTVSLPTKKKQMNEVIAACNEAIEQDAPGGNWEETRDKAVRAYYTALGDHFVEKGKRAEFKQQPKIAVGEYREALYELLNDKDSGIDHADQIAWLEARLAELTR